MTAFAIHSKPKRHRRKKTNIHQRVHVVYHARPSAKKVAAQIYGQCKPKIPEDYSMAPPHRSQRVDLPNGTYTIDLTEYNSGGDWIGSEQVHVTPQLDVVRETSGRYYRSPPALDRCTSGPQ